MKNIPHPSRNHGQPALPQGCGDTQGFPRFPSYFITNVLFPAVPEVKQKNNISSSSMFNLVNIQGLCLQKRAYKILGVKVHQRYCKQRSPIHLPLGKGSICSVAIRKEVTREHASLDTHTGTYQTQSTRFPPTIQTYDFRFQRGPLLVSHHSRTNHHIAKYSYI